MYIHVHTRAYRYTRTSPPPPPAGYWLGECGTTHLISTGPGLRDQTNEARPQVSLAPGPACFVRRAQLAQPQAAVSGRPVGCCARVDGERSHPHMCAIRYQRSAIRARHANPRLLVILSNFSGFGPHRSERGTPKAFKVCLWANTALYTGNPRVTRPSSCEHEPARPATRPCANTTL